MHDEDSRDFPGYAASEVNLEDHSPDCATRLCLAYHFRGRVSCPYGQAGGSQGCTTPSGAPVTVAP
jgi:hypothetical protein